MGDLLCAIHQPNFFPRLSTLAKLYTADIWIVLDNVQFARRDYQHRCYLAPAGGSPLPERWLTVPIHLPGGRATLISDVRLADPALAARRVPGILRQYYKRCPYGAAILGLLPHVEDTLASAERMADVSMHTTVTLLRALRWPGAIYRSSELAARLGRSERLADLASAVGAAGYLCGTGGSRYLDPAPFTARGLHIAMFTPPPHPDGVICQAGHRITALTDLAAAGRESLAAQLGVHALAWKSSPCQFLRRPVKAPA
jgi:hypothetical protein